MRAEGVVGVVGGAGVGLSMLVGVGWGNVGACGLVAQPTLTSNTTWRTTLRHHQRPVRFLFQHAGAPQHEKMQLHHRFMIRAPERTINFARAWGRLATMDAIYTATVSATDGRSGRVQSDDGEIDLPLVMPGQLGGPGGDGTNPEQLFAAGYSACFGSALQLVARRQKLRIGEVKITARVSLYKHEAGYKLGVVLEGEIPGLEEAQVAELMKAAHGVCPYSNATRGNIDVVLKP
jgi:osmotically inducible protein OsmC